MNELIPLPTLQLPTAIDVAGSSARRRFIEFFTAHIRNPNTRKAYHRAVETFFNWIDGIGLDNLVAVEPIHVATYIETLQRTTASVPTVKQHLAAIRSLLDYLVVGQIIPTNPAASVRGPKHIVRRGKTPVLTPDEARQLLDGIPTDKISGLRDRALIGLMVYSFARVGAALSMRVEDVYTQNQRLRVRQHEKGGKRHEMPCHHTLEDYLEAYLAAGGLRKDPKGVLFRTIGRGTGLLTETPLPQANAYAMIKRRAKAADIDTEVCCHTFRATGITVYLKNGGTLEKAAHMANHASIRTTQLYDRRSDEISPDEVERIII